MGRDKKKSKFIEIVDRILKMPEEEKLKRAEEAARVYAERRKKTGS